MEEQSSANAPPSIGAFKRELAQAGRAKRRRLLWTALPFAVVAIGIGVLGLLTASAQRAAVWNRIAMTSSPDEPLDDFLGSVTRIPEHVPYDELARKKLLLRRPDGYDVDSPRWTLFGSCVSVRVDTNANPTRVFVEVERRGFWNWEIVGFSQRGQCD